MSEAFDPDKYLAEKTGAAFDPDKYLAEKTGAPASGFRGGHGASGGWGYPDPGLPAALLTQFHRGLMKDSADESVGALGAMRYPSGSAGSYSTLRMPDGSVVPIQGKEDMYRASRDFVRQQQEAADQHYPKLGFGARMGGEVLSDAALAGSNAASRGYQTLAGLYRGLMGSNAELTPDKTSLGDVGSAGLSTLISGGVANLAPVVLQKALTSAPAQYVGGKLGDVASYAGNRVQDLAGWLKVNSIHPTPLLGEAMDDIPGGVPAVGRELLARGIGGRTQEGTAKQIASAFSGATGMANQLAENHATTGASVDLADALAAAQNHGEKLMAEPATREAGQKLLNLVSDYAERHGAGESAPATAVEALATKRALGDIGYGQKTEFKLTKNPTVGNFGEGVRGMERGINDALSGELGPGYDSANLLVRRLGGAKQAAERAAARTTGNHLIGLLPYLAAMSGAAGGRVTGESLPAAAAMGLGSWLFGKYGAQAGARSLYGIGAGLQSLPRVAQYLADTSASPAADALMSHTRTLGELLNGMRQPEVLPTYAQGDGR